MFRLFVLLLFVASTSLQPVFAQKSRNFLREKLRQRIEQKAQKQPVDAQKFYLPHEGRSRSYYLHVPKGWDGKSPLPAVFLFHGGGGGARGAIFYYELDKKSDEAGFLLVAPNGTGESEDILLTWNVSFGFGYARENKVDDIGFIDTLLEKLKTEFPIDSQRIYATGLSNGAIFCHWLAAQSKNRFAAIAPVVGTIGGKDRYETDWHFPSKPETPVSVCIINGLIDEGK